MKKIILILACLMFSEGILKAQTADEIIRTYFSKTGGSENWKALQSIVMKANFSMQGMEFTGIIYSKRPNKQKSEVDVMGQIIIQAFDGKDAWWVNPYAGASNPQIMPDEIAQSVKENEFESQLLNYSEKGNVIELIGNDTIENQSVYKIKLTKPNGFIEYYYFDKISYNLILMQGTVTSGPQKDLKTEFYFSDFRPVDNIIFPFFMESRSGGESTQKINFTDIKLNEPLEDSIFVFPASK